MVTVDNDGARYVSDQRQVQPLTMQVELDDMG